MWRRGLLITRDSKLVLLCLNKISFCAEIYIHVTRFHHFSLFWFQLAINSRAITG
jgi:hypothetical protein